MVSESSGLLKELQELDLKLEMAQGRLGQFESLLAEVGSPVLALREETSGLEARLREMRLDERRLERSADDRRARMRLLGERLNSVRNLREEAAVQVELDILRRALDGEEQEALALLDQIRRVELRLAELGQALQAAEEEVEPRRQALLEEEARVKEEVALLLDERARRSLVIPKQVMQAYERIRGGGRNRAVATLSPDGACGQCFSLVPLQLQNEIRKGGVLIPCEACGVLLVAGEEDS